MPRRGRHGPPARLAPTAPWYGPLASPCRFLPSSACALPALAARPRLRAVRLRAGPYVSGARRTCRRLAVRLGRHDLRAGELHQPYPPPRHAAQGRRHRPPLLSGALGVGLVVAARFWCFGPFLLAVSVSPYRRLACRPEVTQRIGSPTTLSAAELSRALSVMRNEIRGGPAPLKGC